MAMIVPAQLKKKARLYQAKLVAKKMVVKPYFYNVILDSDAHNSW